MVHRCVKNNVTGYRKGLDRSDAARYVARLMPWGQGDEARTLGERLADLEWELGQRDKRIAELEANLSGLQKLLEESQRAGKRHLLKGPPKAARA